MGFLPNSLLTMGRWPKPLRAFSGLAGTIDLSPRLDPALRSLIAFGRERLGPKGWSPETHR